MTAEDHLPTVALLRLRVSTDGDPSVLTRLLGHFHNLNVTPRRVVADFGLNSQLHVKIDVAAMSEERLSLITAKISQNPCVLNAYWHHL
jgi:hypothetical protein